MKKIGIYDPYLDDCGGGEKYMISIASFLSEKYDVCVFWDNPADLDAVATRFSLDVSKITVVPNIFSSHASTLTRLKKTKQYDSIIFLSDGSIPLVSSKLYLHIQRPLQHVSLGFINKIKLKRVSRVFCNSEYTKKYIDKTLRVTCQVIYPPVELHPKKIKKENVILHVGRFRVMDKTVGAGDYKKQHVMISTFKKMVDQGLSKWKMIMAVSVNENDSIAFEKLKESIKDYPIEFHVNKSNKDLWDLYSRAKIYWHASGYGEDLEKNPELAEHFGISTVEAMGAGAVPVVINAGGQKEIVTDGINGFFWNTIPELIEVTLILINSTDELSLQSEHAKKRAKFFSVDNFKKQVFEMIDSE